MRLHKHQDPHQTLILLHQTNTHIFYLSKSYSKSSDPLLWLINNYSAGLLLRYEARDGIKHINLTSVSKLRDHFNTGHFNTRYVIQARLVECCSTLQYDCILNPERYWDRFLSFLRWSSQGHSRTNCIYLSRRVCNISWPWWLHSWLFLLSQSIVISTSRFILWPLIARHV